MNLGPQQKGINADSYDGVSDCAWDVSPDIYIMVCVMLPAHSVEIIVYSFPRDILTFNNVILVNACEPSAGRGHQKFLAVRFALGHHGVLGSLRFVFSSRQLFYQACQLETMHGNWSMNKKWGPL